MGRTPPKLVLDGTEGIEGRALLLLSALARRAVRFAGVEIVLLGDDPDVRAAMALLRWETGLRIGVEADVTTALQGARLLAAVTFRETAHLPLDAAAAAGVPTLIAIQFPDLARHGAATLALQRAAHDPDRLGDAIAAALGTR